MSFRIVGLLIRVALFLSSDSYVTRDFHRIDSFDHYPLKAVTDFSPEDDTSYLLSFLNETKETRQIRQIVHDCLDPPIVRYIEIPRNDTHRSKFSCCKNLGGVETLFGSWMWVFVVISNGVHKKTGN